MQDRDMFWHRQISPTTNHPYSYISADLSPSDVTQEGGLADAVPPDQPVPSPERQRQLGIRQDPLSAETHIDLVQFNVLALASRRRIIQNRVHRRFHLQSLLAFLSEQPRALVQIVL